MAGSDRDSRLDEGFAALASGRWMEARAAFEAALKEGVTAQGLDGLGLALWWLGETAGALTTRTRAYRTYLRDGRTDEAVRTAIWLASEYGAAGGRDALARGWMRRAEQLVVEHPSPVQGWLDLARSGLETDPVRMTAHAETALSHARRSGDGDLEIRALARSGLGLVWSGRVDEGMARLDEAMAAAQAEENERPETFAETCCDMVTACETILDGRRLEQWGTVAERFLKVHPHPPLLAFCGSCCAGILAARGDLQGAQRWLEWTMGKLESAGHEARCVDPRARLAEIRILQGRLEDAGRLLAGIEGRPEAIRAVVALRIANEEWAAASSILHRRLAKVGANSPLAVPLLALLVVVHLARGDRGGAADFAARIRSHAGSSADERISAEADLAEARVAAADGTDSDAIQAFSAAVERFDRLRMPLAEARARLELAQVLARREPELAKVEATTAAQVFSEKGATREADQAYALTRELGGRGRTGPKGLGVLTAREQEVLELLAEGLTNAEIAERLFISVKTAGNHVSNVLVKLNLRSRTEAAAYALRTRSGTPG